VNDLGSTSFLIDKMGYSNLKVAAATEYTLNLSVGVRRDWPELKTILDKAIDSINPEMANGFKGKWLSLSFEHKTDILEVLKWILPITFAFALIIFAVIRWNRRLGLEISERKAIQLKFSAMSDSSHDAMIMIDSKGVVMFWNKAAETMFECTQDLAIGSDMHSIFVPEEHHVAARTGLESFAKSGGGSVLGKVIELEAKRRNGDLFPVEIAISSFQLEDSWYAVGSIRDITDRKMIEDQVKSARKDLLLIFDNSQVGILFIHKKGEILQANQSMVDILGYQNPKDMIGIDAVELFLDDDHFQSFMTANNKSLLQGNKCQIEYELKKNNDSAVWCSLSGKAVDTNSPPDLEKGIIWVVENITQRRLMEEEIRKSGEQFRIIADYTYGWESWYNKDGGLLWVNPAVERITGYSMEECYLNGNFPNFFIHPEDQHIFQELKKDALGGKEGHGNFFRILHKTDEREIWGEVSWNPVYGKKGNVTGFRTSVQDITPRKAAETEMDQYVSDLEKLNHLTLSREERMIDLKDEINQLMVKIGEEKKYIIR